jgi:hypothetical protein
VVLQTCLPAVCLGDLPELRDAVVELIGPVNGEGEEVSWVKDGFVALVVWGAWV